MAHREKCLTHVWPRSDQPSGYTGNKVHSVVIVVPKTQFSKLFGGIEMFLYSLGRKEKHLSTI